MFTARDKGKGKAVDEALAVAAAGGGGVAMAVGLKSFPNDSPLERVSLLSPSTGPTCPRRATLDLSYPPFFFCSRSRSRSKLRLLPRTLTLRRCRPRRRLTRFGISAPRPLRRPPPPSRRPDRSRGAQSTPRCSSRLVRSRVRSKPVSSAPALLPVAASLQPRWRTLRISLRQRRMRNKQRSRRRPRLLPLLIPPCRTSDARTPSRSLRPGPVSLASVPAPPARPFSRDSRARSRPRSGRRPSPASGRKPRARLLRRMRRLRVARAL